jgi:GTPase Era involved in 16S rRNA processing
VRAVERLAGEPVHELEVRLVVVLDLLPPLFLKYLPEGDDLYPEDTITTTEDRIRYAEIVREKFLERTREEIPYGLGVVVENVRRDEEKDLIVVIATVVVDKEGHKGIVLGAGGRLIKEAGTAAPDPKYGPTSRPQRRSASPCRPICWPPPTR